jgi:hypothetical protein
LSNVPLEECAALRLTERDLDDVVRKQEEDSRIRISRIRHGLIRERIERIGRRFQKMRQKKKKK